MHSEASRLPLYQHPCKRFCKISTSYPFQGLSVISEHSSTLHIGWITTLSCIVKHLGCLYTSTLVTTTDYQTHKKGKFKKRYSAEKAVSQKILPSTKKQKVRTSPNNGNLMAFLTNSFCFCFPYF